MWWDERKVVFGDVGVAVAPATAGPTRVDPAGTLIVDLDCSYTRASVLRAVRDRARTPWRTKPASPREVMQNTRRPGMLRALQQTEEAVQR